MEENLKVIDLLEELEDIVEDASPVPLTGKKMVEPEVIFELIRELRIALPDDIHQAKWIKDERERILKDAKAEYDRIVIEAKKQADYLVETNDITRRATKLAEEIINEAETHSKVLKMRTFDYVDRMLYDMQSKMDELNAKYFGELYSNLEVTFSEINRTLSQNREEIKQMAYETQNLDGDAE